MLIRRIKNPNLSPADQKKRRWKKFGLGIVVILLGILGWIGATGILALNNITAKNTDATPSFFKFGNELEPDLLSKEGQTRINVLLLGVDSAAGLSDSIQIASIDPINKGIALLSVPRDLYVMNPAKKRKTRINEVYRDTSRNCSRATTTCDPNIDYGAAGLKDLLGEMLGIEISYFAKVDFDGLKRIVDTVGGIQVYVEKPLSDPAFPNRTYSGYDPFYIPAGLQTMSGETALKYARCRGGNCGGDFGRAKRQQQVILALKDKLINLNILTNPQKLTSTMTAIGKGFRTDLTVDQINQLYKIVKDVNSTNVKSASLTNGNDGVLKSINISGAYLLIPKDGDGKWSGVQDFVGATFPEPYIIKEQATIAIIDGTGKEEVGKAVAEKLKNLGYNVTDVEISENTITQTTISYSADKPYTLSLLKKRFSVTPKKNSLIDSDIVITLGSTYKN